MLQLQTNLGVEVVEFDDVNSQGFEMLSYFTGADMAFISETVSSGNIVGTGYHTTSTVLMITVEAFVHDDFVLQPENESLYGAQDDNTI